MHRQLLGLPGIEAQLDSPLRGGPDQTHPESDPARTDHCGSLHLTFRNDHGMPHAMKYGLREFNSFFSSFIAAEAGHGSPHGNGRIGHGPDDIPFASHNSFNTGQAESGNG